MTNPFAVEIRLYRGYGLVEQALMQMFGELHAGGATICVVTHDPRWQEQVQRHINLFDGRVVEGPTSSPTHSEVT